MRTERPTGKTPAIVNSQLVFGDDGLEEITWDEGPEGEDPYAEREDEPDVAVTARPANDNGRRLVGVLALVLALFVGACGSVDSTNGNDVPQGPAVPSAGSGNDCTNTGAGVDVVVTPVFDTGADAQGYVDPTVGAGLDPETPPCFDYTTQQPTAPAALATQTAFVIQDGVLQAPSNPRLRILTQWFEWYEPTPELCQAGVVAVVEVTAESMATCAVTLRFGGAVDDPIASYQVSK
jgi:hypothetical protein